MSEFQEKHSVARLIGAPPGYVGYDEGGVLTNAVATRPYSVVLFDEIEKAHPDTFNILLQMLDDGRVTDSHGKTVDFRNTVIIMTSNVGAHGIMEQQGDREKMREVALAALRQGFRPEFINRVDDIVVYNPLTREHLSGIVEIQLRELETLMAGREMALSLTPSAKELLGDLGFDPAYGARPLKRAILRYLKDPLSTGVLAGSFGSGDRVLIDTDGDSFTFTGEPMQPASEGEPEDAVVDAELLD